MSLSRERNKAILAALTTAADEFRAAAEDEMGRHGSVYNVYQFMKESYTLEGKGRNLSRRWGVDHCNCA